MLSFYRSYQDQKFLVIINLSNQEIMFDNKLTNFKIIYNNYQTIDEKLKPYQVIIFDYLISKPVK
ncbi:hypothetical protein [Spiroplasma endosymbiont of Glossina fuscipes fuscipes]|uniref:hypothetical protein n=1 Tax=Spiroplasma endosymbiont of Glossina fuscipes fuscipes TaxID=2004463 RepID=UPI003C72B215